MRTAGDEDWSAYALLLIDVQEDFDTPGLGTLREGYADRVGALLRWARQSGVRVVHAHARFAADGSDWMARYLLRGRIPCVAGTDGARVLDCARPLEGETVVEKQTFDAFLGTELHDRLQTWGTEVLLVAGLVTSTCVLYSASTATQLGYLVTVVEDCCADSPPRHEWVLDAYPFVFDRVRSSGLAAARDGWEEQRGRIAALGTGGGCSTDASQA